MRFLEKAKHKLVKKLQGTEVTAAQHPGPDRAEQQPQIFDSGEADGFYVWPPEVLLSSTQIKPLIIDISVALGGMKDNFDKYLMPSILQTALYMQQLPAAESVNGEPVRAFGHHVNAGGLLLHSLETCYFALNDSRLAFFNRGVNPAQRDENLNVSRIACALAGLLHDIGKLNDPIVVTYTATAKEDIIHGTYYNTALVEYEKGESEEDTVTVYTYQLEIFKYDQSTDEGLGGARFELYQKDENGDVIQNSVRELMSGADGYVTVEGLDECTYYLKETEAPEGFVCSEEELTIAIPDQAGADQIIKVRFANSNIPHTGGTGTRMYTIGVAAIIAAAGLLLVVSRRKKEDK